MSAQTAPDPVRSAVTTGLAWTSGARFIQLISQFAGTGALARLLAPADFGLVNMSAIFFNIANALADFGVRAYIVHRPDLENEEIEAAKRVSWALGLVIFFAALGAAIPLSVFYREPRLAPILAVQALMYLAINAGTVHGALLARALTFDRLARADIASSVTYVATAVGLAVLGAGYWSMVLGRLVAALANLVVVSAGLRGIFPQRSLSGTPRRILAFGGIVAGTGVVAQLDENLDNIVVGRLLGSGPLGVYAIAFNLAALPQRYIAYTVAGVVNPVIARAADQRSLQTALVRYVRYQTLGPCATSIAFSVMAPEVVTVLLGDRWLAAVPLVRIMAVSTGLLCIGTVIHGALVSRGQARALFAFNVVRLVMTGVGVGVGAVFGIRGIAVGFLLAAATSLWAGLKFVEGRLGVHDVRRAAVVPATLVAAAASVGWAVQSLLARRFASSFAVLVPTALAYAAVLVGLVFWLIPSVRRDIVPYLLEWWSRRLARRGA